MQENIITELTARVDGKTGVEIELKMRPNHKLVSGYLTSKNIGHAELSAYYRSIYKKYVVRPTEEQTTSLVSKKGDVYSVNYNQGKRLQNTEKYYKKTKIFDRYFTKNVLWRLTACEEVPSVACSSIRYNLKRLKRRFSTNISDEWRLDFTFIIQRPIEVNIERDIKNLFMSRVDELFDLANVLVEIELEWIANRNITIEDINITDEVSRPNRSLSLKENAINFLMNIFPEKIPRGSREVSIKQLLPQVADIRRATYITSIEEQYYITHKIDGERVILFIGDQSGYLTTTKWVNLPELNNEKRIVMDCELYEDIFYVFDILYYSDSDYTIAAYTMPFSLRFNLLKLVIPHDKVKLKPFAQLSIDYPKTIRKLGFNSDKYQTDGLIMISPNEPYQATICYKWKSLSHMSIDFIAKKCPPNLLGTKYYVNKPKKTLYLLFVGIRTQMARAFGLKFSNYYSLFGHIKRKDYTPTLFMPSIYPQAHLFWHDQDLDDKVVELGMRGGAWRLIRVRTDRQRDYINQQYFGNDFKWAEYIYMNYHNPLTDRDLTMPLQELKKQIYFHQHNNETHQLSRKYNNFVKNKILTLLNIANKWVLDIGAGKGQDYFKYIKKEAAGVIFNDINIENLVIIIDRKYNHYDLKNISKPIQTYLLHGDVMADNFYQNFEQLKRPVDIIVCNFAIHYMVYDRERAYIFANLVNKVLDVGGQLLVSYLSGKKIFDKLSLTKAKVWTWGKYSIKKKYVNIRFTGLKQKIGIELPFSDGYSDEYLFDINLLISTLMEKNIRATACGKFSNYISSFDERDGALMEDDIEYINLLEYTIFTKQEK